MSENANRYPARSMCACTSAGGTAASRSVRYMIHNPPTSSTAATAGWVRTAAGRERSTRATARAWRTGRVRSASVTGAAVTSSSGAAIPSSR
jgi:hypothetical protein